MDAVSRLRQRRGGFVLFALTPPRLNTATERIAEIAETTMERLRPLALDGLILYDIDDESSRNASERPFPFSPTLDPAEYLDTYLAAWQTPVVVYRAVGKYGPEDLGSWMSAQDTARVMTVLVGAPSAGTATAVSLSQAQDLRRHLNPDLLLGGVAIPERHSRRSDEHFRLIAKQRAGCRFFVTQVVYDVNAAKNLVSDYKYQCAEAGIDPAPIVFTFSVCGSMKTLEFLRWLGVDVPRWIENDLRHATDTLATSQAGVLRGGRTRLILSGPGGPLRHQCRERFDSSGRDRGIGRTCAAAHQAPPQLGDAGSVACGEPGPAGRVPPSGIPRALVPI